MPTLLAEVVPPDPLAFNQSKAREFVRMLANRKERNRDCCRELFIGVFFDGTNNNAKRDRAIFAQSNVARLHDIFPQNKESDGFFPIYAPGVGTKFDDIGDSGEGDDLVWGETDRRRGLAFAEKGEARIVWALLQVLNRLSRYFAKSPLIVLAQMYREARLANVPLDVSGPGVTAVAKEALTVASATIEAFNGYVAACKVSASPPPSAASRARNSAARATPSSSSTTWPRIKRWCWLQAFVAGLGSIDRDS